MALILYKTMHDQQECAHELLGRIQGLYENKEQEPQSDGLDNKILEALVQLYAIGINVENAVTSSEIDYQDINRLGEYGLNLLTELLHWAYSNHHKDFSHVTHQLILSLSLWITKHNGEIQSLETIIDTFSYFTNKTAEPYELKEMVQLMSTIIDACSMTIKNDAGQNNQISTWRILNLNRAITATRSHDVTLIRNTYQQLVETFPHEVANFFAEGMHEIERLNYPTQVKDVLQEFFNKYSRPKMN